MPPLIRLSCSFLGTNKTIDGSDVGLVTCSGDVRQHVQKGWLFGLGGKDRSNPIIKRPLGYGGTELIGTNSINKFTNIYLWLALELEQVIGDIAMVFVCISTLIICR